MSKKERRKRFTAKAYADAAEFLADEAIPMNGEERLAYQDASSALCKYARQILNGNLTVPSYHEQNR